MINVGYPSRTSINEKVQGNLAGALNQMDRQDKAKLINYIQNTCSVDFNKAVGDADIVTKGSDRRLKDKDNLIIGIFNYSDGGLGLVAYRSGKGAIIEHENVTVINNKGKEVEIKNFDDLSWSDWLKLMKSVHIVNVKYNNNGLFDKQYAREKSREVNDDNKYKQQRAVLTQINSLLKNSKLPSDLVKMFKSAKSTEEESISGIGKGLVLNFGMFSSDYRVGSVWNSLGSWCDSTSDNIKLSSKSIGTWIKTVGDTTYMIGIEEGSSNSVINILFFYKKSDEYQKVKSKVDEDAKRELDKAIAESKSLNYKSLVSYVSTVCKYTDNGSSIKIVLNADSQSKRDANSKIKDKILKKLVGLRSSTKPFTKYRSNSGRGEDTEGSTTYYDGLDFTVEFYEKTSRERLKDTGYIIISQK